MPAGGGVGRAVVTVLLVGVLVSAGACGGRAAKPTATPITTTAEVPSAAQSVHQGFNHSERPKLAFVGDSITLQARNELNRHFGPTYDVAISAQVGYDTLLEGGDVTSAAKLDPKIVVINLGTNDANRLLTGLSVLETTQTLTSIESRLAKFQTEFPPSTCVIFVTVNTHNPTWNPAGAAAINAYLHSHSNHIADWNAAWSPAYFDKPDSPHPNEKGRQALIATIDRAIARCASAREQGARP